MARLLLKIQGTVEGGFYVSLAVTATTDIRQQVHGQLPPANPVVNAYEKWQANYRKMKQAYRLEEVEVATHISWIDLRPQTDCVVTALNQWLSAPELEPIRNQLSTQFALARERQEDVQILLQTDDPKLRQLPWQRWDLIDTCTNAEIAISSLDHQEISQPGWTGDKPRILVILGNSKGIDVKSDRQEFEKLLGKSQIVFLDQPSRQQIHDALWEGRWDILFFAGHSRTVEQTGWIDINPQDSLPLEELQRGLQLAIKKGLQLAIFNSCDGLGLVQSLEKLHIPQMIVMREPVPDRVAQEFLRYFLQAFSEQDSFYTAVKTARHRLERWQDQIPGASWLPVIYQHPSVVKPITFSALVSKRRMNWRSLVAISLVMTGLVMGGRSQGWLQPYELKAFDHLMQQRPVEGPDPRLLVVGVTQSDVNRQLRDREPGKGSLSDKTMLALIEKLEKYQPRVIGLDILRDHPVSSAYQPSLGKRLASQQDPPLIFICAFRDRHEPDGVPPPPEVAITQTGFNDVPQDDDQITRLLLLTLPPQELPCPTSVSFGLQLALWYLKPEGITLTHTPAGFVKLGDTIFHRLSNHAGGYQNDPNVNSTYAQVLLNYRPYRRLADIAKTVTLQDVLSDRVPAEQIRNKIVLIGRTDTDLWSTPYPVWEITGGATPGVYIHAQATSQILSAVLDGRQLLKWLPVWADWIWVGVWAAIGAGLVQWVGRSPSGNQGWLLAGLTGTIPLLIYASCRFGLLQAIWLPLIPAILASGGSCLVTVIVLKTTPNLRLFRSPTFPKKSGI
jgi:CHASE2 domain-containing sensor protein